MTIILEKKYINNSMEAGFFLGSKGTV